MTTQRTGKELISWGKHWEQGRANEADTGQMWREKQYRNTGGKTENQKPRKHNK